MIGDAGRQFSDIGGRKPLHVGEAGPDGVGEIRIVDVAQASVAGEDCPGDHIPHRRRLIGGELLQGQVATLHGHGIGEEGVAIERVAEHVIGRDLHIPAGFRVALGAHPIGDGDGLARRQGVGAIGQGPFDFGRGGVDGIGHGAGAIGYIQGTGIVEVGRQRGGDGQIAGCVGGVTVCDGDGERFSRIADAEIVRDDHVHGEPAIFQALLHDVCRRIGCCTRLRDFGRELFSRKGRLRLQRQALCRTCGRFRERCVGL